MTGLFPLLLKLVLTIDGMPIDALALEATRFRDEAYILRLNKSWKKRTGTTLTQKESYAIFLEGVPSRMNKQGSM